MSGMVKEGRKGMSGMSGSKEEGGGKNRAREERMSIMMREKGRVHKFLLHFHTSSSHLHLSSHLSPVFSHANPDEEPTEGVRRREPKNTNIKNLFCLLLELFFGTLGFCRPRNSTMHSITFIGANNEHFDYIPSHSHCQSLNNKKV